MSTRPVRTRYAPSPTGFQHIGGIRTALYGYFFTRKNKGSFILRIEDTDQKRYLEGAEQYILDSLAWVGISCDEGPHVGGDYGPYRQSERKDLYRPYAEQLVQQGDAYYAFDTPEELDAMRERLKGESNQQYNAKSRGEMKNSLSLSEAEVKTKMESGESYVIRLKIPEGETITVVDEVRGSVEFQSDLLDDKVIFKSDGMPTYHLANVIDDHLMEISHVIRGEEWLSSTPSHVLMYRFFGWEMPQFAHLPLILKPTGKGKLSKRDSSKLGIPIFPLECEDPREGVKYLGFKEMGFSPDAFVNLLAFLGWNPGTEQEKFSLEELIATFSLERIGKSGAKFDFDKAKWFNEQYLREQSDQALVDQLLKLKPIAADQEYLLKVAGLLKERITFPNDMLEEGNYFFEAPTKYDEKTVSKKWNEENKSHLMVLFNGMKALTEFSAENISQLVKSYIEENQLGFGNIVLPLRLLLSGRKGGPDVFAIAATLGKEESLARMENGMLQFDQMVNA